ncbi:SusC/RagA family TonB-linked outer membrane protein [Sphingobacterium spiritivorum]|uniref:SusC/RagA family TonB-linked outer membrane protein n=1 Tax=Sphingobacterium spiritivorum TaxID=258 RepID=UPI003DA4470B
MSINRYNSVVPFFRHLDIRHLLLHFNVLIWSTLFFVTQVSATSVYAQKITLHKNNAPFTVILKEIKSQTGYGFIYDTELIRRAKSVSINVDQVSLEEALKICFDDQPFSYTVSKKTIIIREKVEKQGIQPEPAQVGEIKGKVVDEGGNPVAGANISVKGESKGTKTNGKGEFFISDTKGSTLVISHIGYDTREVTVTRKETNLIIKLKLKENKIDDVVVTGTGINRKKDSFTGTTAVFSGDELKAVGNNNILQSLRTLDPAFLMIENNLDGSNPNSMPVIEVRGKSSIPTATLRDEFGSNPNMPIFVLDGFPTSVQTIFDLDMNRVSSVTILKDAASTALYGSQASNGVVVIETIKPKVGELRFSYNQDFRLELPDLTSYNMMNAAEKLEFEVLSGRYNVGLVNLNGSLLNMFLDSLYNRHLAAVKRGVDTYWLNEPLQNGYSTNSSINASGGDQAFMYNVGMNYRIGKGAMIGSGRNSYSGSINLTYRKKALNINNITYIRGFKSTNSPYGSFSNFVNANPYFEKNNDNPYLEISKQGDDLGTVIRVINPLYNSTQAQYSIGTNLEVQNNLNINYDISKTFRLNAGMQITKATNTNKNFQSPEMTNFISTPRLRKGRYTDSRDDGFSYQGNLMLIYYKTIDRHNITANWRSTISENQNNRYGTMAEGFPEGSKGNPRFAYNYVLNGRPNASGNISRTLNSTLSVNYAYSSKYLLDFLYRIDGSTAYGRNKQFSPFYSFGLGWNLHNEIFIKNVKWINSLRLTSNMGITGNQNFANITSVSIYNYNSNAGYNNFGQGVSLEMLGNPDLNPQVTRQISTSLDFNLFNNRFSGYLNVYNKKTDPLVVPLDLPSSAGTSSYPYNAGNMTYQGIESKITFFPIYQREKRFMWSVTLMGSTYKGRYDGFGNILTSLNKDQERSRTLLRYTDGNSPEALWAIQSLGIDPAIGQEAFLTKSGQISFEYKAGDIVNIGNTVPHVQGVISTNIRYKAFSFGIGFRYRLGGEIFNSALFNKVENISYSSTAFNQDKRALYDRWKQPGDISQFKAISQTSSTPISSRFVQTENTLSSETLNIGYILENDDWIRRAGLRSLKLNLMANDFMYFSSIKRERGIDYPYARTFAFSLSASF